MCVRIRGVAGWALGKIGNDEAKVALLQAKELEKDEEALMEIDKGLAFFEIGDEV